MKKCTKCEVEQPLDQYNKDCTKNDGYKTQCKACSRKARAVYLQNKKDRPRKKVVSQAERDLHSEARRAALLDLVNAHPVEFRRLVARHLDRLNAPRRWRELGKSDPSVA